MRVNEIRELNSEDLQARIADTRKNIVDLRFQMAARKLESTSKLKEARRTLSRLLTIQTEKGETDKGTAAKAASVKKAAKSVEKAAKEPAEKPAKKAATTAKKTTKK